jgi:hypothetical protein
MKQQNYSNHAKYYAPHHFVFYPLVLVFLVASIRSIVKYPEEALLWAAITGIVLLIGWLSFMLRQHYAIGNQNRIVRLEMRLRYYILTQQRLEPIEQQLSFGQLAALRFASDAELPALMQRAIKEQLSSSAIKKAIVNWEPDHMRV